MRLVHTRGAFHGLLILLLGIMGTLHYVQSEITLRDQEIFAGKAALERSILESQVALGSELQAIALDTPMLQNLGWKLLHSVKSSLSGRLRRGILDHVELFDDSCQSITSGNLTPNFTSPCDKDLTGKKVHWHPHAGTSSITLEQPIRSGDGKLFIVAGSVLIDDQWLTRHAELKALLSQLDLELTKGDEGEILTDFPVPINKTRITDRLLTKPIRRGIERSSTLVIPLFIAIILLVLTDLWARRSEQLGIEDELKKHYDLTRKDLASKTEDLEFLRHSSLSERISLGLSKSQKAFERSLALKVEALHHSNLKRNALEQELRQKEGILETQKKRLAELAELDGLQMQLERTLGKFLDMMLRLRDSLCDTEQGIANELKTTAHRQYLRLTGWREGVTERGSRKFIRSLAETPSSRPQFETELDEAISDIIAEARTTQDLADKVKLDAAATLSQVSYATKIAALWHGITAKSLTEKDHLDSDIHAIYDQAQSLIQLDKKFDRIRLAPLETNECIVNLPQSIPPALWVSSLHQLYLASLELTPLKDIVLKTHLRSDGTRGYLIVQLAHPSADLLPLRSDKQSYHLEIAESMLAAFGVKVTALPVLKGPAPLAITWELEHIESQQTVHRTESSDVTLS